MSLFTVNRHPDRRFLTTFSLGLIAFFLVLGAVGIWRNDAWTPAILLWAIGLVLGGTCLAFPTVARRVYVAWTTLLFPLGWLLSTALLTVVFYGVVTPTAWLRRRRGGDRLGLRFDHEADSYWQRRDRPDDPERAFRQF